MRLIDAEQYRKEFLDSRDFEPMKILDFQPTVQAIPLDKVEQAREEIEQAYEEFDGYDPDALCGYSSRVSEILDRLIAESEKKL